jgi:di/tricarboxylate transporter
VARPLLFFLPLCVCVSLSVWGWMDDVPVGFGGSQLSRREPTNNNQKLMSGSNKKQRMETMVVVVGWIGTVISGIGWEQPSRFWSATPVMRSRIGGGGQWEGTTAEIALLFICPFLHSKQRRPHFTRSSKTCREKLCTSIFSIYQKKQSFGIKKIKFEKF